MPELGARPEGALDEGDAAARVQAMFDRIAPRYDMLNHVLSANIDRLWWWRTARRFRDVLALPEARVMDVCCGTGDMTLALLRRRPAGASPMLAVDFSHGMLARGARKFSGRLGKGGAVAIPIEADAMRLPVASGSQDLLTTAFGFRNLRNYRGGLEEFHRVLRPGGLVGILDFAEPGGLLGKAYALYFRHVLPRLGAALGGAASAYTYLPASVGRFPAPPALMATMREVGFGDVSWTKYSFGIAGLYVARKP